MAEWHLVIAPGPSMQRDDLDALRPVVHKAVAVNCAVFYAPWADVAFATDAVWWRYYGPKIAWFKGKRVSRSYRSHDVEQWRGKWKRTGGNSGHMAIQYTVDHGATQVAIIGFDQQKTDGKAHCHADHPRYVGGQCTNMANAGGIAAWPKAMEATAKDLRERHVEVINLSRETALTCFPRLSVEQFVEEQCQSR